MLPDPEEQPTMRVPELAAALGLAESTVYDAIARGELPSIKIGRRLLIPTAGVRRKLELDAPEPAA